MNVADMAIEVRERRLPEIYDLGIRVMMRYLRQVLVLGLPLVVLFSTLNWWLLSGWRSDDWSVWYPALLLFAFEGPILQGLMTAFLGQAMFSRRPSRRAAIGATVRRLPGLIGVGILRGIFALLLVPLLFFPDQLVPVMLLERLRGGEAWRRAWSLGNFYRSENVFQTLANVLLAILAAVAGIWGTLQILETLHLVVPDPWAWLTGIHPGRWWVQAILFTIGIFLATCRFCAYLDLRTKREGWAIELRMRRAAQAVEGEG